MVDPFSLADPAVSLFEFAVTTVAKKVQEAHQRTVDDVAQTQGYLEAARDAIAALETEAQEILTAATLIDLWDVGAVELLRGRLQRFLYEDRMRPHLAAAVGGLTADAAPASPYSTMARDA